MGCKVCSKSIEMNIYKLTSENSNNINIQNHEVTANHPPLENMISRHIFHANPKHSAGTIKENNLNILPPVNLQLQIPEIEIPRIPLSNIPEIQIPPIDLSESRSLVGVQSANELFIRTPSNSSGKRSGIKLKKSISWKSVGDGSPSYHSSSSEKIKDGTKKNSLEMPKFPCKQKSFKRPQIRVSSFKLQKSGSVYENYKVLEQLGMGACGVVKKVQHIYTQQIRAMKIIAKDKFIHGLNQKEEFEILKTLDHPNIMKLYEYYEDLENYYLIMELCCGGELFKKILKLNTFSEREAAYMLHQVLLAISYCHERKIVHRDLKPQNLLLQNESIDSNIKIIDFGASKMLIDNEQLKQRFGTIYYIAPEVLKGNYNEKCDLWSMGVIAYILLSGSPPFSGTDTQQILKRIMRGSYSFHQKEWSFVSQDAKQFVQKLLVYNPEQRLSAREAMDNPWILKMTSDIGEIFPETALVAFNKLSKFSADKRLQEIVLAFMVSTMQDKEEEEKLLKIFQAFDSDKDGQLSKEELMEGYKQLFGVEYMAEAEVDRIIDQVDINHNGLIDYSEFLLANASIQLLLSDQKLKVAFESFDMDKDGLITVKDLKELLGNEEEAENENYWEEIMDEIEKENDGQINFEEFKSMMTKLGGDYPSPLSLPKSLVGGAFTNSSHKFTDQLKLLSEFLNY